MEIDSTQGSKSLDQLLRMFLELHMFWKEREEIGTNHVTLS